MQRREKSHEWLNQLGRQSWNLELLISGFSIILLIQGNQVAEEKLTLFLNHTEFNDSIFMLVLKTYLRFLQIGVTALLYNLIIHLILRGLWIGAIGLRTVNQGTDLLKLGYTPFFRSVLRKNTPGLDRYIINLGQVLQLHICILLPDRFCCLVHWHLFRLTCCIKPGSVLAFHLNFWKHLALCHWLLEYACCNHLDCLSD
ncbi:MAG: hypothetical protein IPJ06_06110 [Saprospiraceae bacterium]|nr:hypothetical protein [Saprospiraceae bacterium]